MFVNKIFWIVICWAVIVSCCLFCTGKSQGCGIRTMHKRSRIIGGSRSYRGQWPWQVAIFHTDGRSGRKKFHCGGALIQARWVITAAHCFDYDADPRSFTIIAGDYDITVKDSTEQERHARKIIIHQRYEHVTLKNDIALIELSQNLNLTTGYVSTICLPGAGKNLSTPGAMVHVAGWGRTSEKGNFSPILLHSDYRIQINNLCRRTTTEYFNKEVMFCAGDGRGISDACQGDSGSSLVRQVSYKGLQRWVTVGLISWGEGCARVGKYGYNTRVEQFVDWIRRAVMCDLSLGMSDKKIPDGNIRSSTARDQYHKAKEGRLNGQRAWCSGNENNPYLEINLGNSYIITGLATQGSAYDNKWVENYTMTGNLVGSTFYSYKELRIEKVFVGNADNVSVVKHRLRNPFIGRKLRIYPQKQGGFSGLKPACMRVEIYGCDLPSGCVIPGTRVLAKWPPLFRPGEKYLRGYLTEITFASWRVDLENENHEKFQFLHFSKIFDLAFVLDVPPRPRQLNVNTRVLAPRGYKYYMGTITHIQKGGRYLVRTDDAKRGSFTLDQLRLLKMPSVCK